MTRSRLILSLVMMTLMVVGSLIHQSDMDFGGKVFFGAIAMIFFLAASVLMGVTFFVLDEEGRIPHGSLAWRYFASFYTTTEEKDGQIVENVRMPERIKLCPAYWMILFGFVVLTVALAIAFLFSYLIGALIMNGLPESRSARAGLLASIGLVSFVAIVIGVSKALMLLRRKLFLKIWLSFVAFLVVAVTLSLYMAFNIDNKDMSVTQAVLATGMDLGKFIGLLVAVGAAGAVVGGMLFGMVYLLSLILPWVANSLIGWLIAAIFRGLCPTIPVAPAPAELQKQQIENPSS